MALIKVTQIFILLQTSIKKHKENIHCLRDTAGKGLRRINQWRRLGNTLGNKLLGWCFGASDLASLPVYARRSRSHPPLSNGCVRIVGEGLKTCRREAHSLIWRDTRLLYVKQSVLSILGHPRLNVWPCLIFHVNICLHSPIDCIRRQGNVKWEASSG